VDVVEVVTVVLLPEVVVVAIPVVVIFAIGVIVLRGYQFAENK
jgi:hypothetical protein